jgi:hypothetical protein
MTQDDLAGFGEAMTRISAEESMLAANVTAMGSGSVDPADRKRWYSAMQRAAKGGLQREAPSREAVEVQMARFSAMGFRTVME